MSPRYLVILFAVLTIVFGWWALTAFAHMRFLVCVWNVVLALFFAFKTKKEIKRY